MIKKIRLQLLTSIRNKRINVFLLFLLLSFVILIFSKLSKTYTNTIAFGIEKLNVPEADVILNDTLKLNITLKTHGFKWLDLYLNEPKIKIDFSKDVHKTDSVFVWHQSSPYLANTQFDKQVELFSVTPDTLYFYYDVNMVKYVPVKLNADVKFSLGYDSADGLQLIPDSIRVIGPKVKVSHVEFVETERLELDNVKSDINKEVALNLPKKELDLKYSTKQVKLITQVEKFTEGTLSVPVELINVPEGITVKYFPKKLNVSYYVSLTNFNSIVVEDFKVVCDFNDSKVNQSFLVPKVVKSPPLVRNIKIGQQHVEFIITK